MGPSIAQADAGGFHPELYKRGNYTMFCYGVDVSKDTLDISCDGKAVRIDNTAAAIRKFVKALPASSKIAMESTNIYHRILANTCHKAGLQVYLINPRVTHHYREALGMRGHNDKMDAKSVASYLECHHNRLRIYEPLPQKHERILSLMRRRRKLVGIKTQVVESLGSIKELKRALNSLVGRIDALISRLDEMVEEQIGDNQDRANIRSIKGVGPVVSAKLFVDLDAREFVSADAFVAFYGLDCAVNDSGKKRGVRKLTKRGDRLGRTLLYNAAMAAVKTKVWKPVYQKYVDAGWSKIQALIIIARKIARIAWSIYTYKTVFDPSRIGSLQVANVAD